MAVGTLVFDESSYRNVLCLGHILAEDGRKMSKHLGNILEPMPLMDQHGADAVRWFMAASGSPWAARRVGHATHPGDVRKVLLTYWNTVAFQVLYAGTSDWAPRRRRAGARPTARCWTGGRSPRRTGWSPDVTEALEEFDTQRAGALLAAYVDDLSNWYVRRSRRRFWDGDPAALATLHECLYVVTLLMAPMTPFITERVWQDVVRAGLAGRCPSRCTWRPGRGSTARWSTTSCAAQMALARRLVELGRAARAEAKVRTRQPLRRALVGVGGLGTRSPTSCAREVAEELNVGALEPLSAAGADLVDHSAKGNFRALGKRFGKQTPRGRRGDRRGRRRRAGRRAARRRPRHGRRRRRGGRGAARRGDRLRAAARGLVGGQRAGRDRGARPRADPGAGARRPGPRGGPAGAGGPQEQRASRSATGSR